MVRAVLAIVLFASCTRDASSGAAPAGERLYFQKGCTACHGPRAEGTFMGPRLSNLSQHWTREQLVQYIADPASFAERDERLRALARQFRTPMKPLPISPADRELIADYVLTLP
jgi:mono/diheme cytochrome c family protein